MTRWIVKRKCIGESARTFGERVIEHLGAPFPICDHGTSFGHCISMESFSIVGKGVAQHHFDHKGGHVHQGQ